MPRSIAGLIIITVLAFVGFAVPAAGSAPASGAASAGAAAASISGDVQNVASEVAGVQISIAEIDQNWKEADAAVASSAPGANISVQSTLTELSASVATNLGAFDGLAQTASDAFPDLLAQLRADQAPAAVVTATSDLGGAMAAFAAYTAGPSAALLGSFNGQLTAGVSEWNSAVKAASQKATIGPS